MASLWKEAEKLVGTAVAYVYFESEPGWRAPANLMTKDEARKVAAGIAKLPELLMRSR